jgi:hypothetical protein
MYLNYKTIAYILLLLILELNIINPVSITAKPYAAVIIFQGKFIDKESGEPVGATFRFFNSLGKKNQSQSSVSDGSYQVVLNTGDNYYLTIRDYLVVDPPANFELPQSSTYEEIKRNFYVRKITPGMELFKLKIFEPNSKDVIINSSDKLNELKYFMDMNPHINLKITVSSNDSYFKSNKRKVQYTDNRGRIRTKTIRISEGDLLSEFSKARFDELLKKFDELRIPSGHTQFEEDKSSANISRKSKSKEIAEMPNVTISVYKILDFK